MKTTSQCTGCERSFSLPKSMVGKLLRCKHCGTEFRAVDLEESRVGGPWVIPEEQEPQKDMLPVVPPGYIPPLVKTPLWLRLTDRAMQAISRLRRDYQEHREVYLGVLTAVFLAAFLLTCCYPPSPWIFVNYGSLFGCSWLVLGQVQPRLPKHWAFQKTRWLAVFAILWVWGSCDWYWLEYKNSDGNHVTDTRTRWSQSITHRKIWVPEIGGIYEGSYSGEPPKPHGRWTFFHTKPTYESRDEWYWYGDEITQGEWELRRRK